MRRTCLIFLLLLQIIVKEMNTNGVIFTPSKRESPEQGDEGLIRNDGAKENENGGNDADFITPLKGLHKAGEEAREFSYDNDYYYTDDYRRKTRGTLSDPICVPYTTPLASASSEVPLSVFRRGRKDEVIASEDSDCVDSQHKMCNQTRKRKRTQSIIPNSSKCRNPRAKKGSSVKGFTQLFQITPNVETLVLMYHLLNIFVHLLCSSVL